MTFVDLFFDKCVHLTRIEFKKKSISRIKYQDTLDVGVHEKLFKMEQIVKLYYKRATQRIFLLLFYCRQKLYALACADLEVRQIFC